MGSEPTYRAALADQRAELAVGTDDGHLAVDLLTAALHGYGDALRRDPGSVRLLRSQARAHTLLARADPATAGGHLAAAARIDRALVDQAPKVVVLREEYGLVLEARAVAAATTGAPAAALRHAARVQYRWALRLDPTSAAARSGLERLAAPS
jgi:hypothetical protein